MDIFDFLQWSVDGTIWRFIGVYSIIGLVLKGIIQLVYAIRGLAVNDDDESAASSEALESR